ncbi:MAG TPA: TIGR03546 family protein [bacterium]|nr:TIGR03546 family protein [bacterium]
MIKQFSKIIKAMNSGVAPEQIAGGAVLGMFCGFYMISPFNVVIIVMLLLVFNVNIPFFGLSLLFFKALSIAADPVADIMGYKILTAAPLAGIFTSLGDAPVIPLTMYNNTLVAGWTVIGVIIVLPVFIGVKRFVLFYRKNVQPSVEKYGIVKALKAGSFFRGKGGEK